MASLSLRHINKTYPNGYVAVKDFNLEIEDKEFMRCGESCHDEYPSGIIGHGD